jgi:hypothetical protein
MVENIVKHCKNCGPLTIDKTRLRKVKGIKRLICWVCERASVKKSFAKNRDKYLERKRLERTYERAGDTKEMRCSKCSETKSIDKFNAYMFKVKYPYCRDCRISTTKEHHAKEESKRKHSEWYNNKYVPIERDKRYQKTYGITLEQYNEMSLMQNHLCKICHQPETSKNNLRKDGSYNLAVDHCHQTGKIRGLLCNNCNRGIGYLKDSLVLLKSAIDYLEPFSLSRMESKIL